MEILIGVKNMNPKLVMFAMMLVAATLTGCGGGSDAGNSAASSSTNTVTPTSTTPGIDRYLGDWYNSCALASGGGWQKIHVRFTKSGTNSMTGLYTIDTYFNSSCTGLAVPGTRTENYVFNGTKIVGGDEVDRVNVTVGLSTTVFKYLLYASTNYLYAGTGTPGSDGYPTAINGLPIFSR